MCTTEKLIKARMGMLALAEQLNNVSAACRRAGISRSHYYEIKEAFEKFGAEGLARRQRRRPQMPKGVSIKLGGNSSNAKVCLPGQDSNLQPFG